MSNVLSGNENIENVIRKSHQLKFNDFITAGPIPPNPSELILSQQFKKYYRNFGKEL